MTLPAFSTPTALGIWLDEEFAAEDPRALAYLEAASGAIRGEAGENWVDTEGELVTTLPASIPGLTVRIAARLISNPSGVESEATGPFRVTFGPGDLTTAERREIRLALGRPYNGIGTISTTRGPLETGDVLVDVVGSNRPLPVEQRYPT